MGSPIEGKIAEMMADYQKQLQQASRLTTTLKQLTGSATSQRRTLKVTVGAQGELTELEFLNDNYRELPPRELAALIVKTAADARQDVMTQVQAVVAPTLPAGMDAEALLSGDIDPAKILGDEPRATGLGAHYIREGRPGAERPATDQQGKRA